jgi:hypothetical protein
MHRDWRRKNLQVVLSTKVIREFRTDSRIGSLFLVDAKSSKDENVSFGFDFFGVYPWHAF